MTRGRKPKSERLNQLEGNPSHRPIKIAPTFTQAKTIRAPSHMSKIAKGYWKQIAPDLQRNGLLTEADGKNLEMLCEAYSVFRTSDNWTHQKQAMELHIRLSEQFGLTPSSRARLDVKPPVQQDPLEQKFFA